MASIYYYDSPNETNIRTKRTKADEMWVLNPATNEYERIIPGGDGAPVALPYYLKPNSIDIDEGPNGTELTSTALTFGDADGNITIDKNKAKILTDIKTDIIDSELIPSGGTGDIFFVGYDQISKKLVRSPNTIKLSSNIVCTNAGITVGNGYYQSYRFGCGEGVNKLQGFSSSTPANCYFSIILNGISYKLNSEDIQVTNKLKVIAEKATTDANSKMLIYDSTTKAFNYTALPSGGSASVPSYVQPTKLVIPRVPAYDPQFTQIELTNGPERKLMLSDTTLYMIGQKSDSTVTDASMNFQKFYDLVNYNVPKNFWAALSETQFQHVSMTGASGSTQAKVSFLPGGATQAPYFNLPEGGKLFLQVTGLNRSNATRCYGIRLPFFAGNGNLSQYRFTFNANADIIYSGAFSEVFVQNEKVNVYRYLETPSNDANIKAGSYFFYISDPLAIGNFTGTIIVERLSQNYETFPVLTPTT